MKRIYKYHLMDRKDGSIVNKILLPSGDVLTSPKDVASTLIEELKNLQSTKSDSTYASYVPFPELPLLSKEECKEIISNISVNKAIAFDGISDLIFQKKILMSQVKNFVTSGMLIGIMCQMQECSLEVDSSL